jgi:hypothetical protein
LIKNKSGNNYILSDSIITTSNDVDKERVEYIKKIKYETQFYNNFRNTIRILLNDYSNINIREKIESEMLKDYIIYSQKLKNITNLLKKLVKDKIKFIGGSNYYQLIDEVSTCIIKDKENCIKSSNLCMLTESSEDSPICGLILPKYNLITNKENEPIYFGKMADELIRYNRIKSYILQPQTFLSFGNTNYNLRDDEIIMLQSLLTQEYFESLIPTIINKYVRYNSYDEAEPIITQTYDNMVNIDKSISTKQKTCNKIINNKISSQIWQKCFPSDFKEMAYSKNVYCTYECIIDIIEKKTGERIDVNILKQLLYEEYVKILNNFNDKIVDILILEGKKYLGNKVKNNALNFVDFLYNDNYFLTTFDFWLIINKYKIPCIFISSKNILQTNYQKNIFVAFTNNENIREEKFCFVLLPALSSENIPGYKIIQNSSNEIFISLNEINNEECINTLLIEIENKMDIDSYLQNFQKVFKKNRLLKIEYVEEGEEGERVEEEVKSIKGRPKKINKKLSIEEVSPIITENVISIPNKKTRKTKQVVLKGQRGGITKKIIY